MDWQRKPFKIEVKKGATIKFCSCDLSRNAPYCDGNHALENSGKKPFIITFEEDKILSLCGCKNSKNRPYCDGSHKISASDLKN